MSRVTITIHIDIPEGAAAVVNSSPAAADTPLDEAPWPAGPTQSSGGWWPANECPVHHKPFNNGQRGPYCSGKADAGGPVNAKGYCTLVPGGEWQGKRIPS